MTLPVANASTVVPGQQRLDVNNNGYPDAGKVVTGVYTEEAYGCSYVVSYRGAFEDNAYLDSGWILNVATCPDGQFTYLIVHESDPRYRTAGSSQNIWGTWRIVKETSSGTGNVANPMHPEYNY